MEQSDTINNLRALVREKSLEAAELQKTVIQQNDKIKDLERKLSSKTEEDEAFDILHNMHQRKLDRNRKVYELNVPTIKTNEQIFKVPDFQCANCPTPNHCNNLGSCHNMHPHPSIH